MTSKNEEIIEKVMREIAQGDTSKEEFSLLSNMFPELYKVYEKDIRQAIQKALALKEEENTAKLQEIKEKIEDFKKECKRYMLDNEYNLLLENLKEILSIFDDALKNCVEVKQEVPLHELSQETKDSEKKI